ncbi:NAD-dependent epimerase/dehydratase family protein [Pseudomonas benzenivorans]|uniref:NAD-dependent epimerase/dehydratase family protein n=1 Tax=Pseudomonas benzenivorans TaxID=556533 RepID=A0ABZ0PVJ9_9PSED|nr:NAD-dependent epimerase/dehydratase family protein [Pseudomonas benzenivorans]WPC05223.1 NAD-dependent epimerase/dehydratase family protein [Pseudomonas benzenivorans]
MGQLNLVTGANGHLGNTLVRALLTRGERVRAGVRDIDNPAPFVGLDCDRVYAELQDKAALRKALEGVDVLYQVAAVFRHWARDPQTEIIEPNVRGTRLLLEAAAEAGVKRIVYVSSVAAVGHTGQPLDETHWSDETDNAYYLSKILSEQVAWEVARAHGLWMVSVLPSAMIGPNAGRLTDTMNFLDAVQQRRVPLDPNFHFNFVDVRDVAEGMIQAAVKGRSGERYILANRHSSPLAALIDAANSVMPGYRLPARAPRWLLLGLAWLQERWAQLTGQPAELLVSQVRLFYGVRQEYRIAKAEAELGYRPRTAEQALREAFGYLQARGAV